jgi:hypothetical protein
VRLELVSLLKHDPPAAYISENLPRMEDLREAPTRLLDEFEASALQKLRTGEELVVEVQPQEIHMVGALRALKQCTECHSVERGELLGAFTYRLVPANARPRRDAAPARKNAL